MAEVALDTVVHIYSCHTGSEELISQPFVGANRFILVLQNRMSTKNAMGCNATQGNLHNAHNTFNKQTMLKFQENSESGERGIYALIYCSLILT